MAGQPKVNLRSLPVAKHTLGFHDERHTEFLRFREDVERKHRALLRVAGIPLPDDNNDAIAMEDEPSPPRLSKRTVDALRKAPMKVTGELWDFAVRHPAMSRYRGQLLSGYDVDNIVGGMLRHCLEYVLKLSVRNIVRRGRWDERLESIVNEAAYARMDRDPGASGEKVAGTAREVIDLTGGDASPPPYEEREKVVIVIDDDDEFGDLYSNPWRELQELLSPPQTPRKEAPASEPVAREATPERTGRAVPQPPTPAPSSSFSIVVPPPPSEEAKRTYTDFLDEVPSIPYTRKSPRKKPRQSYSIDGYFTAAVPRGSLAGWQLYRPAVRKRRVDGDSDKARGQSAGMFGISAKEAVAVEDARDIIVPDV
ncbi:hypothetical protein Dda_8362 [Drechslerella dactyloides]|uniref:Uncharacterized protein n=1 Tax=Drechslerella dactyloides TaxID=74499 RepID=A0AAD6IS02_DREDA|nr:hypothetical protein Dda_8362 [Drechslerella dactyloides]